MVIGFGCTTSLVASVLVSIYPWFNAWTTNLDPLQFIDSSCTVPIYPGNIGKLLVYPIVIDDPVGKSLVYPLSL